MFQITFKFSPYHSFLLLKLLAFLYHTAAVRTILISRYGTASLDFIREVHNSLFDQLKDQSTAIMREELKRFYPILKNTSK